MKVGLLGCGPIAQFAHLPALARTRAVELVALCDGAEDILKIVGRQTGVEKLYTKHPDLLHDQNVEAVIIAVSDPFHVPLAIDALKAGKHVLVEKPLGTNAIECLALCELVKETGLKLQVGSMKRHDPGIDFAHRFVNEKLGEVLSVSGWYCDTLFRPTMQEALLPRPLSSGAAIRSPEDLKIADKQKYSLVTHGAHLFDNLQYLGGSVVAVTVKMAHKFDQYSWHGLVEFDHGGIGHFELTVKVNADWSEGYAIHGQGGAVEIHTFLPFYNRSSEVRAFDTHNKQWHTPLGADSNPYKRQLEHFALCIQKDISPNPDCYAGLATVRLLEAVGGSVARGERVQVVRD